MGGIFCQVQVWRDWMRSDQLAVRYGASVQGGTRKAWNEESGNDCGGKERERKCSVVSGRCRGKRLAVGQQCWDRVCVDDRARSWVGSYHVLDESKEGADRVRGDSVGFREHDKMPCRARVKRNPACNRDGGKQSREHQ